MTQIPIYYGAMVLAGALGLAKGAIYALILGPDEFGDLNLILLLSSFLVYVLSAGLNEGVGLRLPALYGEGRENLAVALARRTTTVFTAYGLIAVSGLAVLSMTLWPSGMLLVMALLVANSSGALSILLLDSRSKGNLNKFGIFSFLRVLLAFSLGIPGGVMAGVSGVLAAEVVGQALLAFWIYQSLSRPSQEKVPADSLPSLRKLRQEGRPMLVHILMQTVQQSMDRWLIVVGLGTSALGQYSFAALLMMAASLIHATLYHQVGPEALRRKAEGISLRTSLIRTRVVAIKAASLMAVAGIIAYLAWATLKPGKLEPYAAALEILPLILVASVFQVAQLFDWIIAGAQRAHILAKATSYLTVLHALCGLVGIWASMPLWFYAMLTLLSRGISVIIGVVLAQLAVAREGSIEFSASETIVERQK